MSKRGVTITRLSVILFALALVFGSFAMAGPRSAFLMMVGLGFGLTMEGLRFGFAGPWRVLITERDGRGLLAQLMAIGLCAAVALPLLATFSGELNGAHAPVGLAMVLGAFVFGVAMQLVMGCGSGVLVSAGSGNLVGLLALVGFVGGSLLGSLHLDWWTALGSLPVYTVQGLFGRHGGLGVTLIALTAVAILVWRFSSPGKRNPPPRLWWAAVLIAGFGILNLIIAGQPWGVVYGLGLWGAKLTQAAGIDLAVSGYWAVPGNAERLQQSLLTDVTSLTNIGLIAGAFVVMRWRRSADPQTARLSNLSWFLLFVSGLVLGYSARIAFGCNVGAFFSGIATGSLHGWVWFAAAFAGSCLGLRLRPVILKTAPPMSTERREVLIT